MGYILNANIRKRLEEAFLTYDTEETKRAVQELLNEKVSALKITEILTDVLKELGEKFARMEIFLAELIMIGDSMKVATGILEPVLLKESVDTQTQGVVVIGTVKGDIHDVGKNIVATMLMAAGFKVIDLGIDVSNSKIAEAVEEHAPDILGLSALMTTTMPMQEETIKYFEALGIRDRCKIMVGGGPVTREFAEKIGADGYASDAIEAVEVAKKLLSQPISGK